MGNGTDYYAERFARLRTNRNRKVWSEVTAHQAPHKPILLLCVLDLLDSGEISSNFVEISDDLAELFGRYWERVLPFTRPGNLVLPFFHLRGTRALCSARRSRRVASRQLNTLDNLPGYLTNLEGCGIVGPARKPLWPDTASLRWHQENVFD
jgi:predicted restriction endonuclease